MSQKARKVFAIVLIIAFAGWLVVSIIPIGGETKVLNSKSEKKEAYEPKFEDEGNLEFYNQEDSLLATIDVELAEDEQEISYGMMYRKTMNENTGMLFIMAREGQQSFWMKNTYISLDIIYINDNDEVVSIQKYTEPLTETPLPSKGPASKILEVKAGFTDKYSIEAGDRIVFERQ